jgi:hypothetical protein
MTAVSFLGVKNKVSHPYTKCSRMGEGRGIYRVLVGRPEGKRPLERQRRRWKDNIKLDLRETGIDGAKDSAGSG